MHFPNNLPRLPPVILKIFTLSMFRLATDALVIRIMRPLFLSLTRVNAKDFLVMGESKTCKPDAATTMSGADILVASLIRQGVDTVFAYPGGASMPIHQSLTKVADRLRTI